MFRRLLSLRVSRSNIAAPNEHAFRMLSDRTESKDLELNDFHQASDEALEELSEKLESVLEDRYDKGSDVSLVTGVLTVVVDQDNTFVLNKQTPNRQIWLSSPISGPARFDFVSGEWVDRRKNIELKKLLSQELNQLMASDVRW